MTALIQMPIIIEILVSGSYLQFLLQSCMLFVQMAVLEGEMGPIMWIPTIVRTGAAAMIPTSVPPDRPAYITRRCREELNNSWWGVITGKAREVTTGMFDRMGGVSRLSQRGISNNEPQTNTYMAARHRRTGTMTNRRLAKSLELITMTCMAASALEGTTAFDSDSK
jgi:hypothetical protein